MTLLVPKYQIWWSLLKMALWDEATIMCNTLKEIQGEVGHISFPDHARNNSANPHLFLKCNTKHGMHGFLSHPKYKAIIVKCLALKDTQVKIGTRTPTPLIRNTRARVQSRLIAQPRRADVKFESTDKPCIKGWATKKYTNHARFE